MTSTMRIKRKLPPAPKTATKTIRDPRFYSYGCHTFMYTPHIPGWADDKASQERARQTGKAEKKHDMIKRLAAEGLSDAEIADRTGYKPESVRRILSKLRREGEDIPLRRKGRKANDESN